MTDLTTVLRQARERMDKSALYLQSELRGIRTGRATPALVEYVKVDYYGAATDLRDLAQVNVPEPTQIMIKPFDPGSKQAIVKAIETAALGFNPQVDGNAIRINVPPPSAERRKQLVAQVKKMAEESRVAIRNERRDANKEIERLEKAKDNSISEDQAKEAKAEVDELTKKHSETIDKVCEKKCAEIEEI